MGFFERFVGGASRNKNEESRTEINVVPDYTNKKVDKVILKPEENDKKVEEDKHPDKAMEIARVNLTAAIEKRYGDEDEDYEEDDDENNDEDYESEGGGIDITSLIIGLVVLGVIITVGFSILSAIGDLGMGSSSANVTSEVGLIVEDYGNAFGGAFIKWSIVIMGSILFIPWIIRIFTSVAPDF